MPPHKASFHFSVIVNSWLMRVRCSKAMSVLKVEYPDTMDETKLRVKAGGLLDPRLGTIGIHACLLRSNLF